MQGVYLIEAQNKLQIYYHTISEEIICTFIYILFNTTMEKNALLQGPFQGTYLHANESGIISSSLQYSYKKRLAVVTALRVLS